METAIRSGVREVFGQATTVESVRLHGRSLFELYRVRLKTETGLREIAAKVVASVAMARTECAGLKALLAAGAPTPFCHGYWPHTPTDADASRTENRARGSRRSPTAILFMDFVAPGGGRAEAPAGEWLLEDLLRLYAPQPGGSKFGWDHSNYIGSLEQPNGLHSRFADFFWQDRLEAQFRAAQAAGLLGPDVGRELETVHQRCVDTWDLHAASPRLIHGDLWGGNLLAGPRGRLHLIDPSVARSHPEQDLAMLALFGSPLDNAQLERIAVSVGAGPDLAERIPYWQLYPLLVHVNIFGGGYIGQLRSALAVYR